MSLKYDRQKQINDIVSIVKVASFLLVGIIMFKIIIEAKININGFTSSVSYLITGVSVPICVLIIIYSFWILLENNEFKHKYLKVISRIEIIIIMIIYSLIIYISGGYGSEYKSLYLFVIITTAIQSGLKDGVIVAVVSSLIILSMDLFMAPYSVVNSYFENDLILVGVFISTAWPLGFYVNIEREHIKELEKIANQDGLTELYNHRYFHKVLEENIERAIEKKSSVGMIFIDLDYFKNYNDLYGHQKGDYLLRVLADTVKSNIGKNDVACRYGGEEFAIIVPDADEEELIKTAENLRSIIEKTYFEGQENQPGGSVTASIGVAIYPQKAKDAMELIRNADDALYRAKFLNRNRVEVYTSIIDEILVDLNEEDTEIILSIKTLIGVINSRDKYTYGHIERVVMYCRMMAEKLNLSKEDRDTLLYGAYMHDIGKIKIPKDILNKTSELSDDEARILMTHPLRGAEIINSVEVLKNVIPLIECHHEWYDGSGYPNKLKGEEIPYLARILTVVDSFDAMTNNRPYNYKKSYEETISEILKFRGTQFDPEIVDAFIEYITTDEKNKFLEIINDRR